MGRVCKEVQDWVEEQVEQPVETFVNQLQQVCEEQSCNWWCACCNKWLCWLAWVVVRVVTWVLVTVGKWVARIACETVNIPLDILGALGSLILSIPIIGGIIRTIWNWFTEIVWRLLGLIDFIASLLGLRLRKKMYLGVVVPSVNGAPIATDADIMTQVNAAVSFYDSTCNIRVIFTGICHTKIEPPEAGLTVGCDAGGFFNDWWLAGSYFELATGLCRFRDAFRRIFGIGAELIAFVAQEITPGSTIGCSFASSTNYVVVEARPATDAFTMAHEIGHSCWLPHHSDTGNLMHGSSTPTSPTLTNFQIATVRWSKHCVYI